MKILMGNSQYELIHEFDLSKKILASTNGDATVVFDCSTRQYKVLSLTNYYRTNVLEVMVIEKEFVNHGLIYHLLASDGDRNRLEKNSKFAMKQAILKRFEKNKESATKDFIKKIKLNRGGTL